MYAPIVGKGVVMPEVPTAGHVYLWDTEYVARGFGVAPRVISGLKAEHVDAIEAGKHWVALGTSAKPLVCWTELGVVALGMVVRSERGRLFRDLMEDLIMAPACDAASAAAHADAARALNAFFVLYFHRNTQ